MVYSYFVEKLARQSFANVQNHNYDEVLKALALGPETECLPEARISLVTWSEASDCKMGVSGV
jgi:hypothetical protein